MKSQHSAEDAAKTAKKIREKLKGMKPSIGIVLGSGLGGLANSIEDAVRIPFREISGFPDVTVAGHDGAVIAGRLADRDVIALSGRFHMYEGHPASLAAFPVRVFHALGARNLFVSNAAGGIASNLAPGDLMIIRDHLNLMGTNPLIGAVQEGEERFPDMTNAYDPPFRRILRSGAEKLGIPLREGVYAALMGPSYETPSEVKMLRVLGADAVGMSTVPEVIAARALGMRVAGVSCITNAAAGVTDAAPNHEEVLKITRSVGDSFEKLVAYFISNLKPGD
jgi:purine-nucleoside phosphorylase